MPTIKQLQKLLAADPSDAFVLYGLAQAFAKEGRTADALEHYDRCLASDPGYCYAYYHKARALEDAGRAEEAVTVLREGIEVARRVDDRHALSEMAGYLDMLE